MKRLLVFSSLLFLISCKDKTPKPSNTPFVREDYRLTLAVKTSSYSNPPNNPPSSQTDTFVIDTIIGIHRSEHVVVYHGDTFDRTNPILSADSLYARTHIRGFAQVDLRVKDSIKLYWTQDQGRTGVLTTTYRHYGKKVL